MKVSNYIDLRFTGDYSLERSVMIASKAAFVEEFHGMADTKKSLDLAFVLEGSWKTIAVRIDQIDGMLRAEVLANPANAGVDDIRDHLERILFLKADGIGFGEIVNQDQILRELWKSSLGLRPVLFPSPYEAAARAIIGHQLPVKYAATISRHIAQEYGIGADFGDHVIHAFPAPDKLAALPVIKGLSARKTEQLRSLGTTCADSSWLLSTQLLAYPLQKALAQLQCLLGIGPFSAELVLLRGAGHTDVFPRNELRLQRAIAALYKLGENPEFSKLETIADKWRPFRSWAGLILRNSIDR